jgi:intracellular septation protein A
MRRKLLPLLADFAPLLVYYGAEYVWGLQVALVLSIAWVFGECAYKVARRQPFTLFFVFTSGITILFGAIDLYLQRNALFRYEPVATNFLVGAFFLSTLFFGKALIQEMAEKQGRALGPLDPDKVYYFRFLTVVWSIYFWAKAAAYLWIARQYSMEQLTLVRIFAGSASMYALLFASVALSRPIRRGLYRLGLAPSARRPAAGAAQTPQQD